MSCFYLVSRMNISFKCFIVFFSILLNAFDDVDNLERYNDLPKPLYQLNLTQDEYIGIDRVVSRRLKNINTIDLDETTNIIDNGMISPVFEGLGTHYSFIWVGTPPQRVSVILDTGYIINSLYILFYYIHYNVIIVLNLLIQTKLIYNNRITSYSISLCRL